MIKKKGFQYNLVGGLVYCIIVPQLFDKISDLYELSLPIRSDLAKDLYSRVDAVLKGRWCWHHLSWYYSLFDTAFSGTLTGGRKVWTSQVRNQSNLCCDKLQCITSYSTKLTVYWRIICMQLISTIYFHKNIRYMEIFNIINLRTIKQ